MQPKHSICDSDKGTDKLLSLKMNVFQLWYNRMIIWTMASPRVILYGENTIYILKRLYCPKQPKPEPANAKKNANLSKTFIYKPMILKAKHFLLQLPHGFWNETNNIT